MKKIKVIEIGDSGQIAEELMAGIPEVAIRCQTVTSILSRKQGDTLEELLADYNLTAELYEKYKTWFAANRSPEAERYILLAKQKCGHNF